MLTNYNIGEIENKIEYVLLSSYHIMGKISCGIIIGNCTVIIHIDNYTFYDDCFELFSDNIVTIDDFVDKICARNYRRYIDCLERYKYKRWKGYDE